MHWFGLILVGIGFLGLILWASFHGWSDDDWEEPEPRELPDDRDDADPDPETHRE